MDVKQLNLNFFFETSSITTGYEKVENVWIDKKVNRKQSNALRLDFYKTWIYWMFQY